MDDRDELSRQLWLLRQQMEQLVCALDIQQLVLANNRLRWLPMVTENIEHLVEDIRSSESERVATSRTVATSLGLEPDATLTRLVEAVGEPYADIWRQHRLHLLSLQTEIDEMAASNQALTRHGAAATREILGTISGDGVETYDPHGEASRLVPTSRSFDRTV